MDLYLKIFSGLLILLSSFSCSSNDINHHSMGVFVGSTNSNSETEYSYGLGYEYKFNSNWGAGIVFEKTNEAYNSQGSEVVVGEVYYHPTFEFRIGLGFGQEKIGGNISQTNELYRLSISYYFDLGDFGVAPMIALDRVNNDSSTVAGISIIKMF